jgi:hypothetical protein
MHVQCSQNIEQSFRYLAMSTRLRYTRKNSSCQKCTVTKKSRKIRYSSELSRGWLSRKNH